MLWSAPINNKHAHVYAKKWPRYLVLSVCHCHTVNDDRTWTARHTAIDVKVIVFKKVCWHNYVIRINSDDTRGLSVWCIGGITAYCCLISHRQTEMFTECSSASGLMLKNRLSVSAAASSRRNCKFVTVDCTTSYVLLLLRKRRARVLVINKAH